MRISSYSEFKRDSTKGILDRRKNPLLLAIDQQLKVYEMVDKTVHNGIEEKVVFDIFCACDNYLKSKPKGSKRSLSVEKVKYQAIYRLDEIDRFKRLRHDAQHVRAQKNWDKLRTNAIFRGKGTLLQKEFWLETISPHFAGIQTSSAFKEWSTSTSTENFIEWLESTYIPREICSKNNQNRAIANGLITKKVAYLNESERQIYKVTINNGLFKDHLGNIFNTNSLQTNLSGIGWGIFVLSQTHELYIASHKMAEIHHPSFLSGAPVLAAGEIAIDQGKLISISPKSGHYKPGPDSVCRFLFWLSGQKINLHGIPIITSIEPHNKTYYDAYEVMLHGGKSDELKAILAPRMTAITEPKSANIPPKIAHRPAPLPPKPTQSGYLEPTPTYKPPIIDHYLRSDQQADIRVIRAKRNNPDIEDIHFF